MPETEIQLTSFVRSNGSVKMASGDRDHHHHRHREASIEIGTERGPSANRDAEAVSSRDYPDYAIDADNVSLSFGKTHVLADLSMQVGIGKIYGLLGPSGCGKTSLIRCILGANKPDLGTVHVFGMTPGVSGSPIPGPAVGYMPQDISLYSILTIGETLNYFGTLYNLDREQLAFESKELIEFLHLPAPDTSVGVLSGGQKRRVSLATALIHKPALLILDEPTVGVDPLLRQAIWKLLKAIIDQRRTVLITTHYIEEAKDASMIGLMREGKILVQDSPASLLKRYDLPTLEQVFLAICNRDERKQVETERDDAEPADLDDNSRRSRIIEIGAIECSPISPISRPLPLPSSSPILPRKKMIQNEDCAKLQLSPAAEIVAIVDADDQDRLGRSSRSSSSSTSQSSSSNSSSASSGLGSGSGIDTLDDTDRHHRHHRASRIRAPTMITSGHNSNRTNAYAQIGAMFLKNFRSLYRNYGYMLFQFFLPTLEVALFCLCIGLSLHSIPVAVYDADQSPLSGHFLSRLEGVTIRLLRFGSMTAALDSVRRGDAASALVMNRNFSSCLQERLILLGDVEPEVLRNSTIHLYPDMSNQLQIMTINREVMHSFIDVGKRYLSEIGASPNLLELPISTEKPIYGHPDPSFTEFMAPGVMLSITFLAAIPLTTMNLVVERKDGLIERTIVAGVSHFNVLVSHLLCQAMVLLVQVTFLMLMVFPIFKIPYHGEFFGIMALSMAQSFCGMSFGLLVSAVSPDENTATMLSLGAFYPMLLLSGTVWPIEAMNDSLRSFSLYLPQTIPIISMRNMIARGWDIMHPQVLIGFVVTFVWIVIFLILSTLILSNRFSRFFSAIRRIVSRCCCRGSRRAGSSRRLRKSIRLN